MKNQFRILSAGILNLALALSLGAEAQQAQNPQVSKKTARTGETTVTQIQASENQEQKKRAGDKAAVLLSAPQTLKLADMIHEFNKQAGEIGKEKAKGSAVQTHAQQIQHDAEGLNRALDNFEKKTKMAPQNSALSAEYQKRWQSRLDQLKQMEEGNKFDIAFMNHEIKFHQEALQLIDTSLMNNAKNPELKEIIAKTKTSMETSLQQAQYTQNTFSNEGIRY